MNRRRPKAPGWLRIGARTYTVDVDDDRLDEVAENELGGRYIDGVSDHKLQVILLREGSHDNEAETLLHEILHQCLRASGCWPSDVKPGKDGLDVEEQTIQAMTGPLLVALRDHPELVKYLTWRGDTASRERTV